MPMVMRGLELKSAATLSAVHEAQAPGFFRHCRHRTSRLRPSRLCPTNPQQRAYNRAEQREIFRFYSRQTALTRRARERRALVVLCVR